MATASRLKLSSWRWCLRVVPQSRALAALVPGVTQVDNQSDFLGKKPHRQHPGVLHLPHVRLPPALANAAQILLLDSTVSDVEDKVQTLTNYLWSRHLPVEPEELQRRAMHLEKKFLENPDTPQTEKKLQAAVLHALRRTTYHWQELSYNEELSLVYMAARLDGGFAAVSRAFHEVQFDVVVAAFALSELPSMADRTAVLHTLWRKTSHFLVLVENGTKAGHRLLMDARDLVLKGKEKSPLDPRPGFVFAPNKKPKEEKFSMVILARGFPEDGNRWPRITQPVLRRPRHVHCHLCCPDGNREHAVITARRHGRDLYRCARASSWGDLLPVITPSKFPPSPAQDPLQS
ncbi:RSM22-like protein, mitochondrial [Heterocephalus glaber]|uniref:RSM22-like protein, mitochondrial n=1 Tax=Heterocephalus glaber TaxID=10181 RepID=G5BFW6_HETGA|nr:RSM22-like protein, mitochondrial [Heterocephalus glaber]